MFVALVAVIVALVLGHVAPSLAASVRHFDWYATWLRWLDARMSQNAAWRGRFGIAFGLAPPLFAVALFQIALHAPLLGLAGLLFGIAMLFYAWGPRDLDLDVDAVVEARDPVARREAATQLWSNGAHVADAATATSSAPLDAPALVEAVFRSALQRWFGALFWFLLFGATGALLYRLVALAAGGEAHRALPPDNAIGAQRLLIALDWPVAQLMTLSMALVGNFDTVIGAWKEAGGAAFRLDTGFLAAAGRASVRSELADEAQDYAEQGVSATGLVTQLGELPELRDAMSLVWRILLAWLAVLALFVVAGWVS